MSNRTLRARHRRTQTGHGLTAADQAALAAAPRRAVVSALGVLMGTGVITLAFGSPEANAKSAIDELAWLPQHLQTSQTSQVVPVSVLTQAPSLVRETNQVTTAGMDTSVATAAPVAVEQPVPLPRRATLQTVTPDIAIAPVSPARAMPEVANVPAARGAVMQSTPVIVVPPEVPRRALAPTQAAQQYSKYSSDLQHVDASVRMPPAASRPSVRDMQSDLQSLRASVASGAANGAAATESGDAMAAMPLPRSSEQLGRGFASDLREDLQSRKGRPYVLAGTATGLTRQAQAGARSKEASFSDWLDDGSGPRTRVDTTLVPEQAVRAALRTAADAAAARSAAVRQAKNDWDAALADVDQVKGQRWPQVQLGGNTPSITGDSASFNQYNRPTANVAVTTLIYDWGKTSKSIDSRTKTAQAAELYYRAMAQQNAYDIASSLVDLSKNRATYVIGESYVKRMEQLVNMLVEIVKADPGRLSELTQAKSRLLQAQTSQDTVAAQVRSLQLSVRKLVGDEPIAMPQGTHWQMQLDGLDDAVASVSQNPAIAQAAAEAEAAKLSAQSVRAEGLPKLNWVINKNTASDVFGNRQPWSTMLQLSWTPFQGGSQRAAERAALSRASSSSDKHDQLELDSEYKVRDAHRDAVAQATRAKLYAELATETDLVRKQFFEQWYHLNRRTLLDVLSAESDFYNNQVSEVTTEFDSYQAILKLHLNNGTLSSWLENT